MNLLISTFLFSATLECIFGLYIACVPDVTAAFALERKGRQKHDADLLDNPPSGAALSLEISLHFDLIVDIGDTVHRSSDLSRLVNFSLCAGVSAQHDVTIGIGINFDVNRA